MREIWHNKEVIGEGREKRGLATTNHSKRIQPTTVGEKSAVTATVNHMVQMVSEETG